MQFGSYTEKQFSCIGLIFDKIWTDQKFGSNFQNTVQVDKLSG